jgi:hypothetical protein
MIRTLGGTVTVQPGDFACVRLESTVGGLIRAGEILNGSGFKDYEHAFFYAGGPQDLILEAEPGKLGARLVPYHYDGSRVLWSSQNPKLDLNTAQRQQAMTIAQRYKGVPYSFLDYAALSAHRLHLWAPGLQDYIKDTGHMICSQLADQCRQDMGSHLFTDPPRWEGYVTPADLANLILADRSFRLP